MSAEHSPCLTAQHGHSSLHEDGGEGQGPSDRMRIRPVATVGDDRQLTCGNGMHDNRARPETLHRSASEPVRPGDLVVTFESDDRLDHPASR